MLAADHLIRDAAQFRQAINAAAAAEEGRLVTFGIVPTAPETGYGYIEASEPSPWGPVHADQALRGSRTRKQAIPGHRPLHLEQRHVPVPRQPCWRNWSGWPRRAAAGQLEQDTADL